MGFADSERDVGCTAGWVWLFGTKPEDWLGDTWGYIPWSAVVFRVSGDLEADSCWVADGWLVVTVVTDPE
jgi:hypothetical protein